MKDQATFWDRIARKYAQRPVQNQQAYADTLDATRAYLGAKDRVLEIGCGTGTTALTLAPAVAAITGTDISGEMIAIAEEKRRTGGAENVRFLRADAADDVSGGKPFDVVLAFNALHVLADPDAALRALFQQTRPGGYFISKSACLKEMNVLIRLAIPLMQAVGKAPVVARFTNHELQDMIMRAGFEIVETRTFKGAPHLPFIVARRPF